MASLSVLPLEMANHLLAFLDDFPSLLRFSQTCSTFYELVSSSRLSKFMCALRQGLPARIAFFAPSFTLIRPSATILQQECAPPETNTVDLEPGEARVSMSVWIAERGPITPLVDPHRIATASELEKAIYSIQACSKATCIEFNLDKQVFPFWRDNDRFFDIRTMFTCSKAVLDFIASRLTHKERAMFSYTLMRMSPRKSTAKTTQCECLYMASFSRATSTSSFTTPARKPSVSRNYFKTFDSK